MFQAPKNKVPSRRPCSRLPSGARNTWLRSPNYLRRSVPKVATRLRTGPRRYRATSYLPSPMGWQRMPDRQRGPRTTGPVLPERNYSYTTPLARKSICLVSGVKSDKHCISTLQESATCNLGQSFSAKESKVRNFAALPVIASRRAAQGSVLHFAALCQVERFVPGRIGAASVPRDHNFD